MAKKNYYAVKQGKVPGIYRTWDACKAQVHGYPGAIYKGFERLEEAAAFLGGGKLRAPLLRETNENWIFRMWKYGFRVDRRNHKKSGGSTGGYPCFRKNRGQP